LVKKIKAKIIKVDTSSKKIALSIKAFNENLDLEAIKQEQRQVEVLKEEESGQTTDEV
jgi:predicted RNA-binding protein with RPS1 domain